MRQAHIFLLSLLFCACGKTKDTTSTTDSLKTDSAKTDNSDYSDQFKLENYLASTPADTSGFQTITTDCAIIVYPTAQQIDEMQKLNGEEDFATIADDNSFYQSQAMQTIDSVAVAKKMVSKQFVKLVGDNQAWTLDIRKKNLPAWNLIFFKRNKAPEVVPTIMLTKEKVKSYFEK